jgi:hypothetical protein
MFNKLYSQYYPLLANITNVLVSKQNNPDFKQHVKHHIEILWTFHHIYNKIIEMVPVGSKNSNSFKTIVSSIKNIITILQTFI